MRITPLYVLLGAAALLAAAPARAQAPSERWENDIRAFETADRETPPPEGAVLFVGSSSIRMWETLEADFPGVPVIRRGFGGSEIADATHFADRIILPYRPRTVVVYAGDNDLAAGKTPERVFADYRALVDTIHAHLPETKVVYIAVKPSVARWNLAPQIREANTLIREHASHDPRLAFVDVFTPMLGADGTPRPDLLAEDGLHLSPPGYALWRELVAPFVTE